ncbi:ATP-binding protein [Carboxylicivirga mesophila]|uniref:ATP-binding protein n=1 Tax=Carboxylicivirga mesophila TaxID=1166478 RepID=A0ABS5K828_9BACT|nr:ATP-binding protein [Carboxylicivirga mesophila]MBS2211037.1 ATP-binding protein [Carboxylicivirga mesophila]
MKLKRPISIVFTGPESTAKSSMSKEISGIFGGYWIPEYAREYVEGLNRPYTYEDVEKIALHQKDSYERAVTSGQSLVIFDTFLIITKVWFAEVYNSVPEWLEELIGNVSIDLHLLCYPDIKWIDDGVRENESKRLFLFERYRSELENYNFAYEVIKGNGASRIEQAKNHINQLLISNNDH